MPNIDVSNTHGSITRHVLPGSACQDSRGTWLPGARVPFRPF
jgi:hypothetical protein